jgi:DNA (cytosine-5)-methyltransferase 1
VKVVSEIKPKFFVMENVPGMASFESGRIEDQIIEVFRQIGYKATPRGLNRGPSSRGP